MKIINFEQFLECPSGTIFWEISGKHYSRMPVDTPIRIKWETDYPKDYNSNEEKLQFAEWVESDLVDYNLSAIGAESFINAYDYMEDYNHAPISSKERCRYFARNRINQLLDTKFTILERSDVEYLVNFLQKLLESK